MIDDFNTLMTKHLEFRTCISIEKLLKKTCLVFLGTFPEW